MGISVPIHRGAAAAAAAVALALALATSAGARTRDPLYQWTDAAGVVRYTTRIERIPLAQRDSAVLVAGAPGGVPVAAEKPAATPTAAQPEPAKPAQPPVESAPAPATLANERLTALDARIAELEKSIAADEAALADYISDPDRANRQPESGDIAAIAERLPRLQNELRELKQQRAAAAGAPDAATNAAP